MRSKGTSSYFLKQFSFNLLVCTLVFALVMPLCVSFYSAFNEHQKENYRNSLQVMLDDVNASLDIVTNLVRNTEINESFQRVSAIRGLSHARDTIALIKAREYISILVRSNPYIADCMVAFTRNDIILTGKSVYYTPEELKRFYHFGTGKQLDEWLVRLKSNKAQMRFFPEEEYTYIESLVPGAKNCTEKLAFCYEIPFELLRTQGSFFLLLKENTLLQKLPKELLEYSELKIESANEPVYCYRGERYTEDARAFTLKLGTPKETLCLTAHLNMAAVSETLGHTCIILLCYLLGALSVAIGLAVFFTKRQFKPMHTVLDQLRGCGYTLPQEREHLSFVISAIKDMQVKHRDVVRTMTHYQDQLRNMQMDRLLSRPYTADMQIPDGLPERYRIGYAYILSNEDSNSSVLIGALVARLLRQMAPEGIVVHQMESNVFALIIPTEIPSEALSEMLTKVNHELPQTLCMTLGAEAQGVDKLHAAFESAQMNSIGQGITDTLRVTQENVESSRTNAQMGMHIYREVISGNASRACAYISEMMYNPSSVFGNIAECYGYIRLTLCFAIRDDHLPEELAPPPLSGPVPPEKLLQLLLHSAEQLCLAEKERSVQLEAKMESDIFDFIEKHLDDWTLNAETIARQFAISERKVQTVVRQKGEASFSAYLQQRRMLRAAQLLLETDLPVGDISSRSGYNTASTFFKAFKRIYGLSPSEYRSLYSQSAES